jgi:ABC-type methionine transport system ATPase subunit
MAAGVVDKSQVAGREREKELIANLILKHSDNHFEVIAVWGMGGVGKTTLVTDVYQRQEINEKFTKHAFVTVLRPFKLQEFLRSIAIQLDAKSSGKTDSMDFARGKDDYSSMSVKSLTTALDGLSQDRKCLVVVDDLLHTTEWDTIKEVFDNNKKALSWTIVITTRQKDIAEHCCKKLECIHMLNILGVEEAREVFIKTVLKQTHILF